MAFTLSLMNRLLLWLHSTNCWFLRMGNNVAICLRLSKTTGLFAYGELSMSHAGDISRTGEVPLHIELKEEVRISLSSNCITKYEGYLTPKKHYFC